MDRLTDEEKEKIRKLAQEKVNSAGNMGWMRLSEKPELEEYLLGRRLDKHVDGEDNDDGENKDSAGAIFVERIQANIAMDMAAKMREDPLYQIRQKEEESRKKLLENPIRLKQLQKAVQQKKTEEHRKKKKKKHKKKGSDSSDDDDLVAKYLAVLSQKKSAQKQRTDGRKDRDGMKDRHRDDSRKSQRSSSRDSPSPDPVRKSHHVAPNVRQGRDYNSDEDRSRHRPKQYGLLKPDNPDAYRHSSADRRTDRRKDESKKYTQSHKSRSRSLSPKHSKSHRQRSKSPINSHTVQRQQSRSRSRSPVRSKYRQNKRERRRSPTPPVKRKLTDEERQRKLEEMMDNAKWREDLRSKNIKRYKEDDAKEEKKSKDKKGSISDFINPLMAEHASQSSIEDRLHRNKYNIQRTNADLEKSFKRH